MPESLKNFETHQKNYIKMHPKAIDGSKEKVVLAFLEQLIKENDLAICVPLNRFNDILKSNKIKNQLELGVGSTLNIEVRKEATHELFGSSLDLDYTKYPKYGFILDKNPLRHFLQDSDLLFHYGNVIIILKKENFINCTTMTIGSSLDFASYKRKCPMLLTSPNICAIEHNAGIPLFNAIKNGELLPDSPGNVTNALACKNVMVTNYELQFHKDIILTEDIEKICLLPMKDNDKTEFETKYLKTLKELNIEYELLTL